MLLSLSHRSLALGRSPLVRSFVRLLARSVARPPFVSLALRRFCIFIDCHLTSPTTGRPRSAAVSPPLSRSTFPSSLPHSAATATAASCATRSLCPSFLLSFRAITLSSLPLLPFLSRSFFWLSLVCARRPTLRPVSFEASFAFSFTPYLYPRLSLSLSFSIRNPVVLLPPTLDTNSLDAAEFSFEPTIRGLRYIPTSTPPLLPPPLPSPLPRLDVDVDLSASLISRGRRTRSGISERVHREMRRRCHLGKVGKRKDLCG